MAAETSKHIESNIDGVVAYAIAGGDDDDEVGESVCCCCPLQNTLTPVQIVENQRKQICPYKQLQSRDKQMGHRPLFVEDHSLDCVCFTTSVISLLRVQTLSDNPSVLD